MRLRAKDQIHLSAVRADTIKPGEEFEVSDDMGKYLLKTLPNSVGEMNAAPVQEKPVREEKAEPKPLNKAEAAPLNKADQVARKRK